MSQINRVPRGLQDFLGSKNFGSNPSELAQIVAPVLELGRFFAAERRYFYNTAPISVVGNGSFDSVVVPDGEQWLLESAGIRIFTNGTPPFYMRASVWIGDALNSPEPARTIPIAGLPPVDVPSTASTSGAGLSACTYEFPVPLPVFAGEEIFFYADNGDYSGGNTYTAIPYLRYTRLEV